MPDRQPPKVMKKKQLSLLLLASCLVAPATRANDIEPDREFYNAAYRTNAITIDGNMSDWDTNQFWRDTQFTVPKPNSNDNHAPGVVTFEQCDLCGFGGSWTGPDDQSSAFSIAWDLDYLYIGLVVIDDYHANSANSPWNGDSLQMAFTDADRMAITNLYNVALGGTNENLGSFEVDTAGGPMPIGDVNETSSGSGLTSPRVPLFDPAL